MFLCKEQRHSPRFRLMSCRSRDMQEKKTRQWKIDIKNGDEALEQFDRATLPAVRYSLSLQHSNFKSIDFEANQRLRPLPLAPDDLRATKHVTPPQTSTIPTHRWSFHHVSFKILHCLQVLHPPCARKTLSPGSAQTFAGKGCLSQPTPQSK